MLPATALTEYAEKFLGFGNPNAKVWFIGIEEAGGQGEEEVQARLDAWIEHQKPEFADAPSFYPASGQRDWHGNNAQPQATWTQLIRMLLMMAGQDVADDAILDYQRTDWGASAGNTCLAELLPLPSPSTEDWNYGQWSSLPWLESRRAYLARVRAGRENELRRQIRARKPELVVFYGLELPGDVSLLPSWSSIAGGRFSQAFEDREILLMRETGRTTFYVTRHPAAEQDSYFRQIGEFLRRKHGNRN